MYQKYIKTILDKFVAIAFLLLLTPLLLITSLLLLIESPKEKILFRQKRVGYKEKIFKIIKFRSMNNKRNNKGELLSNKERLTPIGRFIRKTSIDELPQLFNILKGDMSLIGPRPLHISYLPLYSKEQGKRHLVKPGITGWAQCHGRDNLTWTRKFELDLFYITHYSFYLDMKILFKTITQLFNKKEINLNKKEEVTFFNGKN